MKIYVVGLEGDHNCSGWYFDGKFKFQSYNSNMSFKTVLEHCKEHNPQVKVGDIVVESRWFTHYEEYCPEFLPNLDDMIEYCEDNFG